METSCKVATWKVKNDNIKLETSYHDVKSSWIMYNGGL
jgi:hypothetical protein